MIVDAISNRERYRGLGERIECALDFLASPAASGLEPATSDGVSTRFDIRGDDVFALVQRYHTKAEAQTFWEAHRRHIDVQCVMEGAELMGWMPLGAARETTAYDPVKDFAVFVPCHGDRISHILVDASMVAIFYPDDVHMPGLTVNGVSAPVKKIVVKVRV